MAHVDLLRDSEWLSVVRKRLRSDGLTEAAEGDVKLLEVKPAAENGEFGGFVGDSLPICVRVQLDDGTEKELRFFIKTVPTDNPAHAAMAEDVFHKEASLYGEFFPLMRDLPPPAKDPEQRDYEQWAPRAFFTRPDLIVMEDLIVQGFVEIDRRRPYDFDHAALALEALARFHASAWLLERERSRTEGRPTPFDQLFPEISMESLYVVQPRDTLTRWFSSAVRAVQKIIPLIPKYQSSPDLEKIVNEFPKILSLTENLAKKSTKYRNVLSHGDLWANNILFRYRKGEESRIPTDVRLVDYQLARYIPPAGDINCLVYLTTELQLRHQRGGDLLRRYYNTLRSALARGGADVNDYVTWDELVAMCDEYQPMGLVCVATNHHLTLMPPDIMKDRLSPENFETFLFEERDEVVSECFRDDQYYREKVGANIIELVDTVILGEGAGFWKRAVESNNEKNKKWKEIEGKWRNECLC